MGPRGAEEADMVGAKLLEGLRREGGWEESEEEVESAELVWLSTSEVVD